MKPVESGRVVLRNGNAVIDLVEERRTMEVCAEQRQAVRRIEIVEKYVVAPGCVLGGRIARRYQHAVQMNVGGIERERRISPCGVRIVVDGRQSIHEMNLK